jgi:putative FmdB family regulatory protein
MPTYQYECEKCGHQFELFQSMTDPALRVCPKDRCARERWGRGTVKRVIGAGAGLLFKGSGFYITDYRSEGYKQAAKQDSAPATTKTEASSGAKPETKPETKPAPKAESKKAPPKPASP